MSLTPSALLPNFLGGRWVAGSGAGTALVDPVLGTELTRVDASGLDLAGACHYARSQGGAALRALSYRERAALLTAAARVLQARREDYHAIATANSGTVRADSAIDIDGGIYTLSTYARLGESLGQGRHLADGEPARLGRDPLFQSQHLLLPARGLALLINAFNFPAWGLWAKAAPALLSGVPVLLKPATPTAWLAQRMVQDVVDAGILPPGALSVVCGRPEGLLDALEAWDLVSFTGSAETAALIRAHPAIHQHSVRANIEADSVNSALLLEGEAAGSAAFELLVDEVVREMTQKSGQKCTAIRRILVPAALYGAAAEAIAARLARTTVGNPRNPAVQMGALVNRAQLAAVHAGLARLQTQARTLHDGAGHAPVDADPALACCVGPTLLGTHDAAGSDAAERVHDTEVFGPVATLLPYRDHAHAVQLIARGQGSLVASVYGSDPQALAATALGLAPLHGRVHLVSPDVGALHTGHGNVMPQSLHGGPGRAGGGEELGGLRALNFYHRRVAIQASTAALAHLA
jgi:3,4-dehydroadipyl-CoA semialdehyde dehydrogenase